MNYDVVVIGAGVSGLAAAYDLSCSGYNVIVLERQVGIGGNAISERFDGFLMEHGPSAMNALVPEANEFSDELGLASSQVDLGAGVAKRYLRDSNGLHGIPTHAFGFLTSPYLSAAGRLSIICEIFRRRRVSETEETVHEFVSRRFGREFADKVMEPLTAGLFAGDSHKLSVASVFPKLFEFERRFGSVTRAIVKARRGSQPGKLLFSWPEGIAALPRALAARLGDQVKTATVVRRLSHSKRGFEVETTKGTVRASAVVLAVQPHVAAMLLEKLDPDSAAAVGEIEAPPLSVVFSGYQRHQVVHPLDSVGFLSVKDDVNVLTGAQFCSTMFPGRAPTGHVSLAGYIGGARNPDLARMTELELIALTNKDLGGLLGIRGQPVVQRVRHWPRGLPQYMIGHAERVRVIESAGERVEGLFLIGNYLHGVSIANCLATARATSARITAQLSPVVHRDTDRQTQAGST